MDPDGWYHTGDIGHLDAGGRLVLSGRTKDRIVLPNGFKVYPEDIENALRVAGIRDAVVARDGAGPDRGDRRSSAASASETAEAAEAGDGRRRPRRRTRASDRSSASRRGGCGRRTTSRARTR